MVAKLAESSHEQRWRVRFRWFQWAGPSASIVQGFAPTGAFVRGRALRQTTVAPSFSAASAAKQRPGQRPLESVAIQPAPCHNKGFNSDAGKLGGGKAGLAQWRRRLTQTLGKKNMIYVHRVLLVGLLVISGNGLSQELGEPMPASESPCNVSCGFDHSNPPECLGKDAVLEYWHRGYMGSVYPKLDALFSKAPADLCFCARVEVGESGRLTNVEVVSSHPKEL